jgi:drug/metabolite transporter (DMT)-like permease
MHALLRLLFAPLLNILEKGDEPYGYKPSHRKILLAVGALFLFLACVSLFFGMIAGGAGAFLPAAVFFVVGVVCLVVGAVGSERAVAKLWGSRP